MIHLVTLGALDLRGADGHELRAVLQQPKRLGLLAYLALALPVRYHRRDSLLALFWPELDQEHARAALRRALYFLRQAIGEATLIGRGEEEVGLKPGSFWCDAVEFQSRLDRGDPAGALELYRGDLLEGFYVAGAPEVERWLDSERTRLRARAATAAWTLSDQAGPRVDEAARWARFAAGLDQDDEAALRRLMRVLDAVGDRRGALKALDDFAERLRGDLDLEPSPETLNLARELRGRTATGPAEPAPVPGRIVVSPFQVHGGPAVEYLAEGMMYLLSTALDGAGRFRAVEPRAILAFLAAQDEASSSDAGARAAVRFGAGMHVKGSVVEAGTRVRIGAAIHDSGGTVLARAEVTAEKDGGLFEGVDDLVRALLAGTSTAPGEQLTRLAALTTSSFPALKAWLQGERDFRLGRYFTAVEAFQRAVAADPSFALAHYRLAGAFAAGATIEPAREASRQAHLHRARLLEHDRLLIEAQHAWLHGRTAEAEQRYTALVAHRPSDLEAWFLLGDLLFHANPARGLGSAAARSAFERALEIDPAHVGALVHLARIEALEWRLDRLDQRASVLQQVSPGNDQALGMRALRAWARRRQGEQETILAELAGARALPVGIAFSDVALYTRNLAGAEAFGRRFLSVARSPELRALCHIVLAHVALARGRPSAAGSDLAMAASFDRPWSLEVEALFCALPLRGLPVTNRERVYPALLDWEPGSAGPNLMLPLSAHNGLHSHLRLFLLGLLEARSGRGPGPALRAEELAELEVPGGLETLVEHLLRTLEAEAHRSRGRLAEALSSLERARSEVWFQTAVASPFHVGAYERFLRASLLEECGRKEEALGWYDAIAQRSPYELPFSAPAHLRQAEILREAGKGNEARRHYDRFLEIWAEAETDLQEVVSEVRWRRDALEG